MAKTYGVGIMGAGNISAAYLRLAPLFKGLEVRAVADIMPEAARKRAEEFGVAAQTPDELLKNSEVNVIVNLTVPAAHYRVSMDIISAGKHSYSEKPFVLTLEEGHAYLVESDAGVSGLVLFGRGLMRFSPGPESEQGQLRIFAGITDEIDGACTRSRSLALPSMFCSSGKTVVSML